MFPKSNERLLKDAIINFGDFFWDNSCPESVAKNTPIAYDSDLDG